MHRRSWFKLVFIATIWATLEAHALSAVSGAKSLTENKLEPKLESRLESKTEAKTTAVAQDADPKSSAELGAYIQKIVKDWRVPGAAVGVIKDDTIVLSKGFGVRKVGSAGPIDDKSMFAIGSCTKAFTCTAIGMLCDDGKLSLDDRVIEHVPGFELKDPYVTRDMRIRDLLSMRTGLEYGDSMWILSGFDSNQIFARLKLLKPVLEFRAGFTYVNAMYIVAGMLIEHDSNMAWSNFLANRIFIPLHMTRTNTSTASLAHLSNVASPHHEDFLAKAPYSVPYASLDSVRAAGSINSCIADMNQWLRFQLSDGEAGGKQLISKKSLMETRTPQTLYPLTAAELTKLPEADFKNRCYCLGWERVTYRDFDLVEHDGSIDGMRATVMLVPETHLGIVVLTNTDYGGGKPCKAIAMTLLDHYLGLPFVDWNSKMAALQQTVELKKHALEQERWSARKANKPFSHPAEEYLGTYANELYGTFKVSYNGKQLLLCTPKETAVAEHWQYDTIKLIFKNPEMDPLWATFQQDEAGKICAFEIPNLGIFKRIGPRK